MVDAHYVGKSLETFKNLYIRQFGMVKGFDGHRKVNVYRFTPPNMPKAGEDGCADLEFPPTTNPGGTIDAEDAA